MVAVRDGLARELGSKLTLSEEMQIESLAWLWLKVSRARQNCIDDPDHADGKILIALENSLQRGLERLGLTTKREEVARPLSEALRDARGHYEPG